MRNTVKGFRLDDNVLSKLKEESREKRITLNNHVNNILAIHNETYRNLSKLHYLWLSPEFVRLIIDNMPEKKLEQISDVYLKDLINQIRYCHGTVDSHVIMETIQNIATISDIPVNVTIVNNDTQYTIIHRLGQKWGRLQRHVLEKLFDQIKTPIKNFEIDHEYIAFTITH